MSGPGARGALWKWRGRGAAGALVLLGLWACQDRQDGPPPPTPLGQPEALPEAPALSPRPPEPSSTPPATPPVKPFDEVPSEEFLRRREAFEAKASVPEQRPPPRLRRKEPGISPKALSRQSLGRSSGKGVAHVLLVSTFRGKAVSSPVEIDGVWRGSTPLSINVPAGSHLIRIDDGHTRVNEFLTDLKGGRSIRMEVDLRPASEVLGNRGTGKHHHP